MHSIYQRFNGISALLSSCLLALLAAIALSSLAIQATRPSVEGKLDLVTLKVYKGKSERSRNKDQEYGFTTFDYEADVTSLFDWNTKQLFLYLSAEFTNAQGVKNDVVLWDRIVRRKRDGKIKVKGVKNKYRFRELSTSFNGASPANFTLKYNSMPYVGLLTYGVAGRTTVTFPPAETSV